jgi:hypothetical protein
MNALDYFLDFHNCSTRELLNGLIQTYGSNLQLPRYRCAHPRGKIFYHIKEIKILDIVPSNSEHLLCLCIPNKIDNSFYNESLFEDGTIYNEFFYLHLEDIIICPPGEECLNKCTRCQDNN